MAAGWVKSLQCKSRAYDDVISCRNTYQNLKDVVTVDPTKPKPKPKPPRSDPFPSKHRRSQSKARSKPKPEELPDTSPGSRVRRTVSAPIVKGSDYLSPVGSSPFFPSVTELPREHPSRNVVEIIFRTRWGPKGFPGRVELVLKVHSPTRTSAHFEAYRDAVISRAGLGSGPGPSARCAADGNEMMRFQRLSGGGGVVESPELAAVRTYSGSGAAHESGGGGEKGRRAMVVCRVIAGRVLKRVESVGSSLGKECDTGDEFDSISGENGELLVFDSRAVLPCFIVIYKL